MIQRFINNIKHTRMRSTAKFLLFIGLALAFLHAPAQDKSKSHPSLYLQLGFSGGFSKDFKKPVITPLLGLDAALGRVGFRAGFQFFNSKPQFDYNNYLEPIQSVVSITDKEDKNTNFLLGFSPYLSFGKGDLRLEPGLSFKVLFQTGGNATAVYHQSPSTPILNYPNENARRNLFVLEPNLRLMLGRPGRVVRLFIEAGYTFPLDNNKFNYSYRDLSGVVDQAGNIDENALINANFLEGTEKIVPGYFSIGAGIEFKLSYGRGQSTTPTNTQVHTYPDGVETNPDGVQTNPVPSCDCGSFVNSTLTYTDKETRVAKTIPMEQYVNPAELKVCAGTPITFRYKYKCNASSGSCVPSFTWRASGDLYNSYGELNTRDEVVVVFVPKTTGLQKITVSAQCGQTACKLSTTSEVQFELKVTEIDSCLSCECGNWGTMTGTFSRLDGQGSFSHLGSNNFPVTINELCGGTPVNLPLNFVCDNGQCKPTYTWSVIGPVSISNQNSSVVSFTPTVSGQYTIVARVKCGDAACQALRIPVYIKKVDPCLSCNCSNWGPMTGRYTDSGIERNFTTDAKGSAPININKICNGTPITLPLKSNCVGNGCSVEYNWYVTGAMNIPGQRTSVVNFIPRVRGQYTIVAQASCGSSSCEELRMVLNINDIDPCVSCDCGSWGTMSGSYTHSNGSGNILVNPYRNTPITINEVCKNTAINLPLNYNCTGACNVSYSWAVVGAMRIPRQNSSVVNFTPNVSGQYTIIATVKCGDAACQELRIPISIQKIDPCLGCDCGSWGTMSGNYTTSNGSGNILVNPNRNTPITINEVCKNTAINLPLNYNCTGGCNVSYSWAVVGAMRIPRQNSSVVNFKPNVSGQYTIIATVKCGDAACQELRIPISIQKIDPCLGCDCGSWGTMSGSYTHSNGSGNILVNPNRNTPITINEVCKNTAINLPLNYNCTGGCNVTYSWSVIGAMRIPQRNSSVVNFTPSVSGQYTIIAKAKCGDAACQELRMVLNVREIDPCISCDCGSWGSMSGNYTTSNGRKSFDMDGNRPMPALINQVCKNTAINLPLNFNCTGGCNVTYSWSVIGAIRIPQQNSSVVNFTPSVSGQYTIIAKAKCGDAACQELRMVLNVREIDPCISCDCGSWGSMSGNYTTSNGRKSFDMDGNRPMPALINQVCKNTAINLPLNFNCTGGCNVSYSWSVIGAMRIPQQNSSMVNFTPSVSGQYTIIAKAKCGDAACQELRMVLNVREIDPCISCDCGSWGSMSGNYTTSNGRKSFDIDGSRPMPALINQVCKNTAINLPLNFNCTGGCNVSYSWSVIGAMRIPQQNSSVVNFTPSVSGQYTIVAKAKCGDAACQELRMVLNVREIDPCISCDCGSWGSMSGNYTTSNGRKSFDMDGNRPMPALINQVCKNTAINLPLNYNCTGGCNVTYSWSVIGAMRIPQRNSSVVNFTPSVSGQYTIIAKAKCGDAACQELRMVLNVREIDPCISCDCGSWGSMSGSYTHSSGRGNFDVNPNRLTPVNINQVCAGKPINLSLKHSCTSCNLSYDWSVTGPINIRNQRSSLVSFTPKVKGTYTIVAKAKCGDVSCKELRIVLNVREINPCLSCGCGSWGTMKGNYTHSSGIGSFDVNPNRLTPVNINQVCAGKPINLSLKHSCTSCNLSYDWSVTGPINIRNQRSSLVSFTPKVKGTYTIVAKAKCGDVSCKELRIVLNVREINPCLSCGCGSWGTMKGNYTHSSGIGSFDVNPNRLTPVNINQVCAGKPINLSLKHSCTSCNLSYDWSVTGPINIRNQRSSLVTFTPNVKGTYTIIAKAKCGDVSCRELRIVLNVRDVDPCLACECNNWGNMTGSYTHSGGKGSFTLRGVNPTPVNINQVCAGTAINLPLQQSCKVKGCKLSYSWSVTGPMRIPSRNSSVVNFVPKVKGQYTIIAKAQCGDVSCKELRILVNVGEINPCLNCECGTWGAMSGSYTHSGGQGTFNFNSANTTVNLNKVCARTAIRLPLSYSCKSRACNVKYSWSVSGPMNVPLQNSSVVNFSPKVSGKYTILAKVSCGDAPCKELRMVVNVIAIDPCVSCSCGSWGAMKGTYTNSDGQMTFSMGGARNMNVAIEKICEGTSINLPLNYRCSGDKCKLSYTWSVSGPVNLSNQKSSLVSFKPVDLGVYTIIVKVKCGDGPCQELRFTILVKRFDSC